MKTIKIKGIAKTMQVAEGVGDHAGAALLTAAQVAVITKSAIRVPSTEYCAACGGYHVTEIEDRNKSSVSPDKASSKDGATYSKSNAGWDRH